jgi:3',5'-cyclic AMP phosphodiesterase CpdA
MKKTLYGIIGAILLAAAAGLWAKDAHFYFAQVTDTHIGQGDYYGKLEHIINSINQSSLSPAFVAVTGDLTNDKIDDAGNPEIDRGTALFRTLKMPVYFLPGNHDVNTWRIDTMVKAFTDKFGPIPAKTEVDGVVCLFFFVEPFMNDYKVEGYDPLGWLEKELKAAKGKPVILFQHNPFVEDFYLNQMHDNGPDELRAQWAKLLNDYKVKAVITGHFHKDELHWVGNVPVFVCEPAIGTSAYRVYEYKNGKLSYRTVY